MVTPEKLNDSVYEDKGKGVAHWLERPVLVSLEQIRSGEHLLRAFLVVDIDQVLPADFELKKIINIARVSFWLTLKSFGSPKDLHQSPLILHGSLFGDFTKLRVCL